MTMGESASTICVTVSKRDIVGVAVKGRLTDSEVTEGPMVASEV